MSGDLGAGFPRWGPSQTAAVLVERRLGLVAADWHASCPEPGDEAETMVRLLALALHDCGGNTAAGHVHPSAGARFEAARAVLEPLDAEAIMCLREVLRRQVLLDLSADDALDALHCVSAVLDELQRRVAAWGLDRLQRLAYLDELTGLGNRRAAHESAQSLVATAVRHGRPLVAVVIDVDGLKVVNDRDGHDAGDALLRRLADAFRSGLRQGDAAFRTGGDEFLVLLPETDRAAADAVLARVRAAGAPSFSHGTAEAPAEAADWQVVVRLADQRLLAGRRRVRSRGEPASEARPWRPVRSLLLGTGLLAICVGAVLAARAGAGLERDAAVGITGAGIATALLVAAVVPGSSDRTRRTASVVAPLLGMAAATAAAPLLDAEVRPAQRIEHVADRVSASSPGAERAAFADDVPTGTTAPPAPSYAGTAPTSPTRPTLATSTTTATATPRAPSAPTTTPVVPVPSTDVPSTSALPTTTTTAHPPVRGQIGSSAEARAQPARLPAARR